MEKSKAQLIRRLGETIDADETVSALLLIDPFLKEPFDRDELSSAADKIIEVPLRHRAVEPDQQPRLIALGASKDGFVERGIEQALREQFDPQVEASEGFSIGGWIFSKAPAEKVARHLASVMQQRAPNNHKPQYFRWADRRVLEWMWPVLSTDQQQALLGPIQQWWTLDRIGRWVELHSPQLKQTWRRSTSFRLTSEQWQHAERGQRVHAMVRAWQQFIAQLPEDYLAQASHAVAAARKIGLSEEADVLLLGAYVLQIHPRLTQHPAVRARVTESQTKNRPLSECLSGIPDPGGWDVIREELNMPEFQSRAATQ